MIYEMRVSPLHHFNLWASANNLLETIRKGYTQNFKQSLLYTKGQFCGFTGPKGRRPSDAAGWPEGPDQRREATKGRADLRAPKRSACRRQEAPKSTTNPLACSLTTALKKRLAFL